VFTQSIGRLVPAWDLGTALRMLGELESGFTEVLYEFRAGEQQRQA
jgi:hypothetical protein